MNIILASLLLSGLPLELECAQATARAHLVLVAVSQDTTPDDKPDKPDKPNKPDPNCPKCKGTGTRPSGDGLGRIPCDCFEPADGPDDKPDNKPTGCRCGCNDPSCTCGRSARVTAVGAAQPKRQVLLFSAVWCGPCGPVKAAAHNLEKQFTVGEQADAQLRIVDGDKHPELLAVYGVSVYPTLLVLEDGVPTTRLAGTIASPAREDTLTALLTGAQPPPTRPTTTPAPQPITKSQSSQSAQPAQSGPVYYYWPNNVQYGQPYYQPAQQVKPRGPLKRLLGIQ